MFDLPSMPIDDQGRLKLSPSIVSGLDIFTDVDDGLVPASGGGVANFLRADQTWAVPPGTYLINSLPSGTPTLADEYSFHNIIAGEDRKALGTAMPWVTGATSLGTGAEVWKDLSGQTLRFNTLKSQTVFITIVEDPTDSEVDFNIALNALTVDTPVQADLVMFYDVSGADHNRCTITSLPLIAEMGVVVDNRLVRTDLTSGKLLQQTGITADDSNNLSGIADVGCGTVTAASYVQAPAINTDLISRLTGGATPLTVDGILILGDQADIDSIVNVSLISANAASPLSITIDAGETLALGGNGVEVVDGDLFADNVFAGNLAPTGAEYLVAAAHAGLSAERVGTNSDGISWDFTVAGQAKVHIRDTWISTLPSNTPGGANDLFIFYDDLASVISKVAVTSMPFIAGGSNLGAGVGVFEDVSGQTMRFNSLKSNTPALTIVEDTIDDQVEFAIANFTSTEAGLVPLSGGGTTNFLRADAAWAAPPGGDNVSVNGTACSDVDLDDNTPAAPSGAAKGRWQKDSSSPNNVSVSTGWQDLAAARRYKPFYWDDCFSNTSGSPWQFAAISSGQVLTQNPEADHPGISRFRSHTSNASSGAYVGLGAPATALPFLLAGGETFEIIFRYNTDGLNLTNAIHRFGFHDTISASDAVDGCYLETAGSEIYGKTSSNSSRSTTGSTYTPSTATWYRGRITVNDDATEVLFEVFDDSDSLLWDDTLSSNIPTGAGRYTQAAAISTYTTPGGSNRDLLDLDLIATWFNDRALVR